MKPEEINRIVTQIDETRRTEHFRDHDCRPDSRTFKPRSRERVSPEIVRAQTRCRTAAWRNRMDRRAAPDSHQIGMSLLNALITSRLTDLTLPDRDLVGRALVDLESRGFSIVEARNLLRRMRKRYGERHKRKGEPREEIGAAFQEEKPASG